MTFNVNTDANYAAYVTATNGLNAYDKAQYDAFLIKEFANQVTAGATLSGGGFTTILAAVLLSVKTGNYQF